MAKVPNKILRRRNVKVKRREPRVPDVTDADNIVRLKRPKRKEGGEVAGKPAAQRADRKPRADGGRDMTDLGYPGMTWAQVRRKMIRDSANDAINTVAGASPITRLPRAAAALVPAARGAVTAAEEVAPVLRSRPEPYRAEGRINVSPPPIPRGAPRTLFQTANNLAAARVGSDGDNREWPTVGVRTDREMARPEPAPSIPISMEIRAQRPAAPPPESTTADRLNALSLGQSRMGPIQAVEAPANAAERASADLIARRRAQIEATPTEGGVVGNFRHGGKVKNALNVRQSPTGKPRR